MSMSPHTLHGIRWGTRYGQDQKLVDSLAAALTDQVTGTPGQWQPTPMASTSYLLLVILSILTANRLSYRVSLVTGENLADKYGITREQCDAFGLQSQKRWAEANAAGAFTAEIAPVTITTRKGVETFSVDEHPRPETTLEGLAKLSPVFKKGGTVTAGTASGMGDGAAANVVMSEEALKRYGVKPLARIVSWGISAVEPTIMGIGPVEAVKQALRRASLKLDEIDIIELNEVCGTAVKNRCWIGY